MVMQTKSSFTMWPIKTTGTNAGGPRQFPMRTRWTNRVAPLGR